MISNAFINRAKRIGRAGEDVKDPVVRIRSARTEDIKDWAAMRHELWPRENAKALKLELPGLLRKRRFKAWIALESGKPVGFAEAYVREFANGCESQPVAFLEGIWIREDLQGWGIGRKLVKAVESWARKRGLRELGSDAILDNQLSLWAHRSWGFKETERVVYFRKQLFKEAA